MKKSILVLLALAATSLQGMEKQRPSFTFSNISKDFPLHLAVINNDRNQVLSLLNDGFFVNQVDMAGFSPLHYAAANGNSDIVTDLLNRGADVGLRDLEGHTPLWQSLSAEKNDAVSLMLIRYGAYEQTLHKDKRKHARLKRIFKTEPLLEALVSGAIPTLRKQLNRCSKSGNFKELLHNALRIAINYDNTTVINFILEATGGYLDEELGGELFIRAAQAGHVHLLEYFYLRCALRQTFIEQAFTKAVEARHCSALIFLCRTRHIPLSMLKNAAFSCKDIAPYIQEALKRMIEENLEGEEEKHSYQEALDAIDEQMVHAPVVPVYGSTAFSL